MIPADFPWRAGMRTTTGLRIYSTPAAYPLVIGEHDERVRPKVYALPYDAKPDLTDGATIGALANAVREAFGDPRMYAAPGDDGWWYVRRFGGAFVSGGSTESAAWLAAWLAAWIARPRGDR